MDYGKVESCWWLAIFWKNQLPPFSTVTIHDTWFCKIMATTNKSAQCHNSEDHNLSLQIHSLQSHPQKTTFPAEFITIFIVLRYVIVSLGEWCLTFQDSTFVSSSWVRKSSEDLILHWISQTLKIKPTFCPKTLRTNQSVMQHHVSYPRVMKTSTTSQQKPKISWN